MKVYQQSQLKQEPSQESAVTTEGGEVTESVKKPAIKVINHKYSSTLVFFIDIRICIQTGQNFSN